MNGSIPEFEPCHAPLTADDITWHQSRPSYNPLSRSLSYDELFTLTECEAVLDTLSHTETAAWILDLIADKTALRTSLRGCMDALHGSVRREAA
jgi:hypothetical protein